MKSIIRYRLRRSTISAVGPYVLIVSAIAVFGFYGCSEDSPSAPPPTTGTPLSLTSSLQITSHPRGSMSTEGTMDVSQITLSGMVCDTASTIIGATINGQPVTLQGPPPCQDFSTDVESRWGLNTILGTATNASGYTENLVHSYMRSPNYFTPAGAAAADKVPRGVYLHLNQNMLDDQNRNDADDVATLLWHILSSIDLNAAVTDPIIGPPGLSLCFCPWPLPPITIHRTGFWVRKNGALSHSGFTVDNVTLTNSGLDIQMGTDDLRAPITVTGYLGLCIACGEEQATVHGAIEVPGGITINASVDVSIGANGRADARINSLNVNFVGLWIDIDWTVFEFLGLGDLLNTLVNSILNQFQNSIETLIEDVVRDEIPSLVELLVDGFGPPVTVTLPAPMNTVLNIDSDIDLIDFSTGGARIGYAVSITPDTPVLTSPMGPIQRGGNPPTFGNAGYDFGIGVKDDLLNQFLWAAWKGGAMEIPNISALGCDTPEGMAVSVSATLPPVVMPGTNGNQIDIGVGDILMKATPVAAAAASSYPEIGNVAVYAATTVGATITMDPNDNHLVVSLQNDAVIDVQVVSAPQGADLDALRIEYAALFECMIATVIESIIEAYPLPSLAIGALPGVPPGTRWISSGSAVGRQDPYHTITGVVLVK